MSTTANPHLHARPVRVRSRAVRILTAAAALAAVAAAIAPWSSSDTSSPSAAAGSAKAYPGGLTASESATVVRALTSHDARVRRIARSVAAGEAGASALADPALLHHHGLDTSRAPSRNRGALSAERFHHRRTP